MKTKVGMAACVLMVGVRMAAANGGPFVVKYPGGDPAAKGVLARLDPNLKPAGEERLKVLYENLSIEFGSEDYGWMGMDTDPMVRVTAEYRISNPSDQEVEVDFGFPIVRGIRIPAMSMMPRPDVFVTLDGKNVQTSIISTSAIYGLIREQARRAIDAGVAADARLAALMKDLTGSSGSGEEAARTAVIRHLAGTGRWSERESALMADYGTLNLGTNLAAHAGFGPWGLWGQHDARLRTLPYANMGSLAAIGEQKATQFLALLAGKFDPAAAADYEGIFKAWGGDVRERSVDLGSGSIRPREISLTEAATNHPYARVSTTDPTVYARVDYLNPEIKLDGPGTEVLKRILKNLPVTFTFAPMNLLHYRVAFKPMSEQTVTVRYTQYAYLDTAKPESYQLSYVVHPASFWKEFGKINLTIKAPDSVRLKASVPCERKATEKGNMGGREVVMARYEGEVVSKTGELFVGIDKEEWAAAVKPPEKSGSAKVSQAGR